MFDKCTGVAVIKENKILLGLRTDGQGWSLAGGKMEENESLDKCGIRELFEEFGLVANNMKYMGQVEAKAYVKGVEKIVNPHIYLCDDFSGEIKLQLNEMKDYRWVSLDEIEEIENLFPPSEEAIKMMINKIIKETAG